MARALGLVDRRLLHRMAVCLAGTLWLHGHAACQTIVIDQLGYRPNDPKIAFVRQAGGGNFEIKDVATNKTVFAARSGAIGKRDPATGDGTFALDFSPLKAPGIYKVWLPEAGIASEEF